MQLTAPPLPRKGSTTKHFCEWRFKCYSSAIKKIMYQMHLLDERVSDQPTGVREEGDNN